MSDKTEEPKVPLIHFMSVGNSDSVQLKNEYGQPGKVYCLGLYYNPNERNFYVNYVIGGSKDNPEQGPIYSNWSFLNKDIHLVVDTVFEFIDGMFEPHEKEVYLDVADAYDAKLQERLKLWITKKLI